MKKAHAASRIFTGLEWLQDHAVIVDGGIIQNVIPLSHVPADCTIEEHTGFIAPAFIDLQIYGAYGKLLAVYPEPESLTLLNNYDVKGGAAFCMPTVATNTKDVFFRSIDAVRTYWKQGGKGIMGLHLEGPWINPVKRGAHIESLIHPPTITEVKELLEYGKDVVKIITLAPEVCSKEIIELILSYGIVISAGHSNADYAAARDGFNLGITAVTHLFNAMSPLQHRAPGLVGATMNDTQVMASIIPDGHHVDFAAIQLAKGIMKERLFIITDAVTETGEGEYQHYLAGDKYEAAGILSGSALDMASAVRKLVEHTNISLEESLRMASMYPAKLMGLQDSMGMIAPGLSGAMVVMSDQLKATAVIGNS